MKTIRYIILGLAITLILFGNLNISWGQHTPVEFLETYTKEEIYSGLDPEDRFFRLMETNRMDSKGSSLGTCHIDKSPDVWKYIHSKVFLDQVPGDVKFAWGVEQDNHYVTLYALKKPGQGKPGLNQNDIEKVNIERESQQDSYSLLITFSEEGKEKWAELTGANVGRDIAIVIDNTLYAAPRVMEQINLGKCMISGNFNKKEISALQAMLDPDHH